MKMHQERNLEVSFCFWLSGVGVGCEDVLNCIIQVAWEWIVYLDASWSTLVPICVWSLCDGWNSWWVDYGEGIGMVVTTWDELGEEMLELHDCVVVWLVCLNSGSWRQIGSGYVAGGGSWAWNRGWLVAARRNGMKATICLWSEAGCWARKSIGHRTCS
jgi:hypothetical protein